MAWVAFIWSRSVVGLEESAEQGEAVESWVRVVLDFFKIDYTSFSLTTVVRKSAHFIEYGVLGTLVGMYGFCYRKFDFYIALLSVRLCFYIALIDETIQIFSGLLYLTIS